MLEPAREIEVAEPLAATAPTTHVPEESVEPADDGPFAELARQWEREPDDHEWTEHQRVDALDLFAELQVPEALLRDVLCRRSVCRIVVDASNPLRLARFAEHLREHEPSIRFRLQDGDAFAYVPRHRADLSNR